MRLCAIHQPTFFPWLGYFDKIRQAEIFVFLDRADYQKSGKSMGSWCNRVRVKVNDTAQWISCPVIREHGPQSIHTIRIDEKKPWRDTIRKILEVNYRKAPNFSFAYQCVDRLLAFETEFLADFNINAIITLAELVGVRARYIRETELAPSGCVSTARLVKIVTMVGADAYLCGAGADGYMDPDAFPAAGLQLIRQHFIPTPYGPADRFLPGLSVIDWLMYREC